MTMTRDRICSQSPTAVGKITAYILKSSSVEERLHASQMELEDRMRDDDQERFSQYTFLILTSNWPFRA
jgi:hypothetical protein